MGLGFFWGFFNFVNDFINIVIFVDWDEVIVNMYFKWYIVVKEKFLCM